MPSALQSIDSAGWQEALDYLLPRKPLLRPDEVAKAIGCDERTVLRRFEDGTLFGHELKGEGGERLHRRYRRESVILFLAANANYAPADLRIRLLEVAANLPRADKALLYQQLGRLLTS